MKSRLFLSIATFLVLGGCVSTQHSVVDGICYTCLHNPITDKPLNYDEKEFLYTNRGIFLRGSLAAAPYENTTVAPTNKTQGKKPQVANTTRVTNHTIEGWLKRSKSGLSGKVINKQPIRLANNEKAYLVKLNSQMGEELSYAIARPRISKAQYLDDLDLFRAYNNRDIVIIQRPNQHTILVLEGGGSHQGVFNVSRQFVSFNGWRPIVHHQMTGESNNTGSCGSGYPCEVLTTSYQVISKSPLKIRETTIRQTGSSPNRLGKKHRTNKTVLIR